MYVGVGGGCVDSSVLAMMDRQSDALRSSSLVGRRWLGCKDILKTLSVWVLMKLHSGTVYGATQLFKGAEAVTTVSQSSPFVKVHCHSQKAANSEDLFPLGELFKRRADIVLFSRIVILVARKVYWEGFRLCPQDPA